MSIGWFLKGILLLASIIAIIISLLQCNQSDNAVHSLSGQSNLFASSKEQGPEKLATRLMYVVIVVFFGCILGLNVLL